MCHGKSEWDMPGILCVFNKQTSSSTNNFYSYCEHYETVRNSEAIQKAKASTGESNVKQ